MESFELMFSDLNDEAKARFLKFQGVEDASELNWEVLPIATIDKGLDDEMFYPLGEEL